MGWEYHTTNEPGESLRRLSIPDDLENEESQSTPQFQVSAREDGSQENEQHLF